MVVFDQSRRDVVVTTDASLPSVHTLFANILLSHHSLFSHANRQDHER
jgi:hypothetical protein